MANNLLDRLLSVTGLKAPDFERDNSNYSNDGLTGVERYLAKITDDQEQQIAHEETLSGVEKYLQAHAEVEMVNVGNSQAKPLSGVDKYLASQDKQPAKKPASAAKKPAAVKKPASGVDKYLSQQPTSAKKKTSVKRKSAKPAAKKPAPAKKSTRSTAAATKKKAVAKPVQNASAGRIDLSANANQCQAGTARGGQCKRTTSLMKLQRTINKQKYQFLVCSQHHNDTFKPYKGLI